jgi:hypothetical protein
MWNSLIFGLASFFTPQASLPDAADFQAQIDRFAQVYAINTGRIQVRESQMNNPSPFLTQGGIKHCTLHINQSAAARQVWSHFLDSGNRDAGPAFLAFAAAHELTHCMMSEPGKRPAARKALEQQLNTRFTTNTQFEETLADLVGLAYVGKAFPEFHDLVLSRVKAIRQDFSSRDPEHDSSAALTTESLGLVDRMFSINQPVRLAEIPATEKIAGN